MKVSAKKPEPRPAAGESIPAQQTQSAAEALSPVQTEFDTAFAKNSFAVAGEAVGAPMRANVERLKQVFKAPEVVALREIVRFVEVHGPRDEQEFKALTGHVEKIIASLESTPMTRAEKNQFLLEEVFIGKNFPPGAGPDYRQARMNMLVGLGGSLGALANPMTAVLLPLVLRGGFDVGRLMTVVPHYIGDEVPNLALGKAMPGATLTSFPTVKAFLSAYKVIEESFANRTAVDSPLVLNGWRALVHHVLDGYTGDRNTKQVDPRVGMTDAVMQPEVLADFAKLRSEMASKSALLALLGPMGSLVSAFVTGGTAGLLLTAETHRNAHIPFSEKTVLGSFLASVKENPIFPSIGSRQEHAAHHKPEHDVSFTVSWPQADAWFDGSGAHEAANLLLYAATQNAESRAIPISWVRNPDLAQAVLGSDVDLSQARVIAKAKQALVDAYDALVLLNKRTAGDFLNQTPAELANGDRSLDDFLMAAQAGEVGPTLHRMTCAEIFAALRRKVDGVEMTVDDIKQGFELGPWQKKFIFELVPQAPSEAWPPLHQRQVATALARIVSGEGRALSK